jgi:hypothetical protein
MADRDLILGVLAAQAGFVTPAQVMAAASARMLARDGRSLLDHLVDSGALSPERRDLVTTLANEALDANGGSPERLVGEWFDHHRHLRGGGRGTAGRAQRRRAGPDLRGSLGVCGSGGERASRPSLPHVPHRPELAAFPLPGPDTSSPAESFRRALDETGFQMRGVELEVASP